MPAEACAGAGAGALEFGIVLLLLLLPSTAGAGAVAWPVTQRVLWQTNPPGTSTTSSSPSFTPGIVGVRVDNDAAAPDALPSSEYVIFAKKLQI